MPTSPPFARYYSPFPEEYNQYPTLHFCEFCLKFFGHRSELDRHAARCKLRHPPGNEIYRSHDHNVTISVFELDGAREVVYCEYLSLISKLFLDHKFVGEDCSIFLYYVVCEVDQMGCHIVGYFSKVKSLTCKNNLACILTLPCHQRKGYGKFIISLSYELSKIEERVGSPEEPISDLGKVSYMSYWTTTLVRLLDGLPVNTELSIDEISKATSITTANIIENLKFHGVLVWSGGRWNYSAERLAAVAARLADKAAGEERLLAEHADLVRANSCQAPLLHWTPHVKGSTTRAGSGKSKVI